MKFKELITDELLAAFCVEFKTTLTKAQGDAWRFIATECDAMVITDANQVAYILGTVWNECRFKSIKEIRAKQGTEVWKLQERYWHTGYYGRGFSQLTWSKNYKKFSPLVGRDLVKNPDDVLLPAVGAKIIVTGMAFGMFTGKRLSQYFTPSIRDWMGARSIVNGKLPGQKYGFMAKECAEAAQKICVLLTKHGAPVQ